MATTSSVASSSAGLDVPTLVSQLMSIERQPIDRLNTKVSSYQTKISSFGTISGLVSSFQTALKNLDTSLTGYSATPSDTSIFSASAASTAAAGSYSLEVTNLAHAQSLVAVGQTSSTTAIGSGTATTVTFDFGTISGGTLTAGVYSGATFTSNGSGSKSITIDGTNNTLQGIRDTINAAKMGVTATIVNDGSATAPYRLALSSDTSGVSNSLKITTSGEDSAIDSLLANDPGSTSTATAGSSTAPSGSKVAAAAAGTTAGVLAAGALIANTSAGAISIGAVMLGSNAKTNGDNIALAINTALAAAPGGAAVNGTAVADGAGIITITAGSSAIALSMGGVAASSADATARQNLLASMTGFSAAQLGTQAFLTQNLNQTVAAQNAAFKVNGIAISKSSNTITDAIQDVTLTLNKPTTTPATLTVARDTNAVSTAVSGLVDAYNALASQLKSRSAYGNATTPGGALAGDKTLHLMLNQLHDIFNTAASGGTLTSLAQVGITSQADGSLKLDSSKLNSAMASNFSDVTNLFSSATGFTTRLNAWSTSTLSADGLIGTRTNSLDASIKGYNDQINRLEIRMKALQKQFTITYSNLNVMLNNMNGTSAYLTQQLGK